MSFTLIYFEGLKNRVASPESWISRQWVNTWGDFWAERVFRDIIKATGGLGLHFEREHVRSEWLKWHNALPWAPHDCRGNGLTAGADTLPDLYKQIYLWRLTRDCIQIRTEDLKHPGVGSGEIDVDVWSDGDGGEDWET